jgi:erythronate-4-phosphate dehydrogenase
MKIIADDKIPFLQGVLEPFADVVYLPGKDINREHLMDADALLIRTRTKCNEKLLKGTPVKFIATATIGFDHIDTDWCENNNIFWTNAPGCNSGSVYQYIAATLVTLATRKNFNLSDRSLGVIGVGNVGKKIVRLGEHLGMRVLLNDPPRSRKEGVCGFISMEGIMRECDIITCHVPLNMDGADKTHHLVNEQFLSKLNAGTIIINSSRGEVVDTNALKNMLNSSDKLQAAVLDVWENEPDIDVELLSKLDIATPHIAGYSADGKVNGTAMSVQALSRFFNLPLKLWVPNEIPVPENTTISIDCNGKTLQEILTDAILFTYPIVEDDLRLRNSISTFEKQRGAYPLRREFRAFTVNLKNDHSGADVKLKNLGFQIQTE